MFIIISQQNSWIIIPEEKNSKCILISTSWKKFNNNFLKRRWLIFFINIMMFNQLNLLTIEELSHAHGGRDKREQIFVLSVVLVCSWIIISRENMLLLCDTVVLSSNRIVIFEVHDLQNCTQSTPAVTIPQHPTSDPCAATLIAALLSVTQGNTFSGLSLWMPHIWAALF